MRGALIFGNFFRFSQEGALIFGGLEPSLARESYGNYLSSYNKTKCTNAFQSKVPSDDAITVSTELSEKKTVPTGNAKVYQCIK